MKPSHILPSLIALLLFVHLNAVAQDCPDGQVCATVRQDGITGPSTFSTIQDAIDNLAPDQIFVYPGVYEEQVRFTSSMTISAIDGPLFTVISGGPSNITPVVFPTPSSDPIVGVLSGFTVTSGFDGIEVQSRANATIRNCVVENNQSNGIRALWDEVNPITEVQIINCVLQNNISDGIEIFITEPNPVGGSPDMFNVTIQNSIFLNNQNWGVNIQSNDSSTLASSSRSRFIFNYNNAFGNTMGSYNERITGGQVNLGQGLLSLNPQFVGTAAGLGSDARLSSTSQMKDSGWDGTNSIMRDPDGTRNDMGAYGGPFSAGFFESPDDGPEVRNIVAPATVRQGDMITIQATGVVR